jgi:hypothetical protein
MSLFWKKAKNLILNEIRTKPSNDQDIEASVNLDAIPPDVRKAKIHGVFNYFYKYNIASKKDQ